MRNLFRILAFGLLLAGGAAFSQTPLPSSVHGAVYDPAGAAVPGVAVTITDDAGKLQQTTITDESGLYSFSVPPGRYTLLLKPSKKFQEERVSPVIVTSTLVANQVTLLKVDPRWENIFSGPGVSPIELLPATTVPALSDKKRRPSFSLRIRMVNGKKTIAVGATIKLSITMRNISRSQIFFEAAPGLPQLIGFRPDLRDTRGQPVLLTEYGKQYFEAPFSTTSDLLVPLD